MGAGQKTTPFCFINRQFYHVRCKTIYTSIQHVNNNSFTGPLIIETFEKRAPGHIGGNRFQPRLKLVNQSNIQPGFSNQYLLIHVVCVYQFRFLGNFPTSPPLAQHFSPRGMLMLTLSQGRGRWTVSHKPKLIYMCE